MKKIPLHTLIVGFLVLLLCTKADRITGAGSETTNSIAGVVFSADNHPQPDAVVHLIPSQYDAVKDGALSADMVDTTNRHGEYAFQQVEPGVYSVYARSKCHDRRALESNVRIITDSLIETDAVLKKPGTLKIPLSGSVDYEAGYIYIPGTPLYASLEAGGEFVIIDSVPHGSIPEIVYASKDDTTLRVLGKDIDVMPGDTIVLDHAALPNVHEIFLNTTAAGAGVTEDVHNFALLIRLNEKNFDFAQVNREGSPIRFAKADDTPLPFEIERWDSLHGRAEVWVKIDTIYGSCDSQYINMSWGYHIADTPELGSAVFDTSDGYVGVWHLGEQGDAQARDATGNHYDGIPTGMAKASSVSGIVGNARDFDGVSSFIHMPNTADSKLSFPENGMYAISLWAFADIIDTLWHGLASKGHQQYYMQYKCFNAESWSWEFVEYKDMGGWEFSEYFPTSESSDKNWVHLTGVREGNRQYLYVNGQLVQDTAFLNSEWINERNTSCDFSIGAHLDHNELPDVVSDYHFDGKIDEVRVMSVIPTPAYVKLCYMNQKEKDLLVTFR